VVPPAARIPTRGRHHDVLDSRDWLYLAINRAASVPFTYHYLRAAWVLPSVKWCAAPLRAAPRACAAPARGGGAAPRAARRRGAPQRAGCPRQAARHLRGPGRCAPLRASAPPRARGAVPPHAARPALTPRARRAAVAAAGACRR
jgi:hypothetical protein